MLSSFVNLVLFQSAGELENDEHTAGVIMQMVRTACRFRLHGTAEPPFKRMSGKKRTCFRLDSMILITIQSKLSMLS